MFLTLTAIILLSMAAVLYFWNQIKDCYTLYFSKWIEQCCGSDIREICDDIFSCMDCSARYVRRSAKELKDLLGKIFLKHELSFKKINSEQTEIKETIVVRQKDGSFVQRDVTRTVDNDEIPFSVVQELHKNPSKIHVVDGNKIIEKQIDECLEN